MVASKKMIGAVGAVALSIGALTTSARAEDSPFSYAITLTGASDYMFRGISYTGEDPTVNSYIEFDYNTGGILGTAYIAFWTSNIDTGEKFLGPWEQDIYLGIRPVTGPISWDIAAYWYIYGNKASDSAGTIGYEAYGPGNGSVWDTDYVEFKIGATATPITNLTVGATVWLTPDQDLASPENVSIEGTVAFTLPNWGPFTPTISGLIGYTTAEDNDFYFDEPTHQSGYWAGVMDYTYWNAGLKLTVDRFFMDFRYWDTDIPADAFAGGNADERFVFSAGVNLAP